MSSNALTEPLHDSVPKVDDAIAVGEDLDFQRKWWRFERIVWCVFLLILVCDLLGIFGRGLLANATVDTPAKEMTVHYERVVRAGTPSVMTLQFTPDAVHNGYIRIYIGDSLVRQLGAQRIAPQPQTSQVGDGGIAYAFPSTGGHSVVQISLEPSFPGLQNFYVSLEGAGAVQAKVLVLP